MIFVTVGTEGPFDRLIRTVDRWAAAGARHDVFAQIGKSTLPPRFIRHSRFLEPAEFRSHLVSASAVVAHAGMGTILMALHHRKPLLVMPRRASLGEQRNEHQLATARRLLGLGRVTVAFDETELAVRLDQLDALIARQPIGPYAQPQLIAAIREFIRPPHVSEPK